MQKLTVLDIVKATGGELVWGQENKEITNITRDSREVNGASLFVPLKGEKRDGHDFIDSVVEMGAAAVITAKEYDVKSETAVIKVHDTLIALGDIARYYKEKYNVPTLAVSGSVGKTTTKDMIYSALSAGKKTHKTDKNYNNHIGVPETVFGISADDEMAVIEMGMNHFNEIDYLASIVKPDAAVITNIGVSHIGNLGSREGIFKAKMEITNYFSENNTLIVNGDDDFLGTVKEKGTGKYKVIYYGTDNPNNDIKAYDIENKKLHGSVFKTMVDGREYTVTVTLPGRHNIYNALAAICAAKIFGVDIEKALYGIENASLTENRQEIIDTATMTIIKDCYNASPDSIKAALEILSYADGREVAFLGDVLELGSFSEKAHYDIGDEVIKNGVDLLVTAGENAKFIAKRAKELGLKDVFAFDTTDEAAEFAKTALRAGDSVLIKASHGMHFEKIYDAIEK